MVVLELNCLFLPVKGFAALSCLNVVGLFFSFKQPCVRVRTLLFSFAPTVLGVPEVHTVPVTLLSYCYSTCVRVCVRL